MRELDQTIGAGLDQLSEGFAIFDEHLRLIHCNRPFHRVRDLPESLCRPGVTLAQLFKHNAERGDYGPGDAGSQVSERIDQISRREPRDVEMTLSSGRIVLARYRPLPDGGLVVTYEDISDLRRANAGLQRERERYELVTEAVSEGIYDWDVASDQLLVSDTLRTMFGFGVGQLTSRVWYACVHPDDAEPYRIAIRNLFKGDGERFQHEYRIRLPSGEYRWVLDRGLAIRGGDGRVRRLVGAVSDVTQAKIGESLLREARDRALAAQTMFEQAIASMSEGFALFDADDRIVVCNERYREFFLELADLARPGVQFESLIRAAIDRGMFPAAAADPQAWLAQMMHRRRQASGIRMQHLSSGLWLQVSDHRMPDGSLVSIYTDVTALKSRERELDDAVERLQQQDRALQRAKEAAEEASRLKSDFVANMSHEIRTPMNAIIGMTHLALQTELDDKQRDYLLKVETAAKGLLGILNDVLDFSKIEAGKLQFEQVPFSLDDVLDRLADLSAFRAQDKGLELLFDVDPAVPTALIGDPMRLGQVLLNLVSNAIKFTERGEVTVRVRRVAPPDAATAIEADDRARVTLLFEVQDTGIGLSAEQLERLYSPFSQADTSTTRKYGGTGLGLSISKRLVEMMDGEVGVESEQGVGSTFRFTARLGLQAQQAAATGEASPRLAGARVLVVDDNPAAREIFASMLRSMKLEPQLAASGAEALDALRQAAAQQRPFGLVLMDWQMPGLDGVETIRRMRADATAGGSPAVIMASAYSREQVMQAAAGVAIDGFVAKPATPSSLLDRILIALGGQRRRPRRGASPQAGHRRLASRLAGARVLLVEDNAINRELAGELLAGAGVTVDVAADGLQALQMLDRDDLRYDAVLMDCQMPVMDGYEATRRIRETPRHAALPIIAMTANAMAEDRRRCLQAGMNDHVPKPLDVRELLSTLNRWIRRDGESAQDRAAGVRAPGQPIRAPQPPAAAAVGPTVDLAAAVARLDGNARLLGSLIQRFCASQHDVVERLRAAVDAHEFDTAAREAHTLKSHAAALGASRLASLAARLEQGLAAGERRVFDELVSEFAAEIRQVLDALAETTPTGDRAEPHPPQREPSSLNDETDHARLTEALQELAALIRSDDIRAARIADQLLPDLDARGHGDAARKLRAALSNFQFEQAQAMVDEVARRLHGGPLRPHQITDTAASATTSPPPAGR